MAPSGNGTAVGVTAQVLVLLLANDSLADLTTTAVLAFVWGVSWAIRSGARPLSAAGASA